MPISTAFAPIASAAGDFNRDGKLDLVTANSYGDAGGNTLNVLLGNGRMLASA